MVPGFAEDIHKYRYLLVAACKLQLSFDEIIEYTLLIRMQPPKGSLTRQVDATRLKSGTVALLHFISRCDSTESAQV